MRSFIFTIVALSLFFAGFVSAAYAHVDKQGSDWQFELSADQDSAGDIAVVDSSLCTMHSHNHIAPVEPAQNALPKSTNKLFDMLSESVFSSFLYELKRPPKA